MTDDSKTLVRATVHGAIWGYVSQYSAKLLVFVSTAILARLLAKEDFGLAGYAILTTNFVEVFQGFGLRSSLIYYDRDEEQNNTAFWLALALGILLLAISVFVIAPLVGLFFNDPRAVPITQVLSIYLPLESLAIVHDAMLSKDLAFRRKFTPDIASALGKGLASILFAVAGYGVWSLIYGQLMGVFAKTTAFWYVSKWRPKFKFNQKFIRPLIAYGFNIFSVGALSTLLANVDYLIIGRFLGAEVLGVYTLAFRIPELLIKQFSGNINKVIFPIYTRVKDDAKSLVRGFLATLKFVNLITMPMGFGLAAISSQVILVFFSEKWLDAGPVMVVISYLATTRAMVFSTGNVFKAIGRPEILTKINFWQVVITFPVLWWTASRYGDVLVIAWAQTTIIIIASLINLIVSSVVLDISLMKMFRALQNPLIGSILVSFAVHSMIPLLSQFDVLAQMILAIGAGGLVYFVFFYIFDRNSLVQFSNMLTQSLKKKKTA